MDVLSQIIALLRPQALLWKVVEAHGDWALRFPGDDHVVFGQVIAGACRLELPGREAMSVCHGDFLLMTAPTPWVLRSEGGADPLDFETVHAGSSASVTSVGDPDDGPVTRFIAGHFELSPANADLLGRLLPSVIHIRSTEVAATRVGRLLAVIGDEATDRRPGRSLILDRLLEVMLVEALRHETGAPGGVRGELLAGLSDPKIGPALREMHGDVRRAWTVAELAASVAMSRAAFAERFSRTVGMAPIDYLLHWRMALAKDMLRSSDAPLLQIAETIGYRSASAFSTAFRRIVGHPPARYRLDE